MNVATLSNKSNKNAFDEEPWSELNSLLDSCWVFWLTLLSAFFFSTGIKPLCELQFESFISSSCILKTLKTVLWSIYGYFEEGCREKCAYTGRFATTIFSVTPLCNVGTMLYLFETMLQECVALKLWSSLRIVACNITLKREIRHFHARRSRAVTAKKCTKKRDGCAELLFCQAKPS